MEKHVVYLIGLPGVGKTTVGSDLADKTGFALLDNHLIYREVCQFLPRGRKQTHLLNGQLHLAVLRMLLRSKTRGIVCTLSIRREPTIEIARRSAKMAEEAGAIVDFIRLECDWEEHCRRVQMPSRQEFTKTNSLFKLKEKMAQPCFNGLEEYPRL